MVRAFLAWFWGLLDGGKVDMYLVVFYSTLLLWGIVATFFVTPIEIIETVMGQPVYDCWAWMNIIGTSFTLAGMLPKGGPGRYIGLWMQTGGNACMFFVLFSFEYSALVGTLPLDPSDSLLVFIMLALAPYTLATVLLAMQAARKLWLIEQLKREEQDR